MASGRKLKNLFIQGGPQLRMFYPFAALFLLNFVTLILLDQRVMSLLDNPSLTVDENASLLYRALASEVRLISIVSLVVSSAATFFLWLRSSHKVAGPQLALSRQLTKMIEGDFTARVQLRNGDELQEIATQINELALRLTLEKSHSPATHSTTHSTTGSTGDPTSGSK